jgi:hypothetical protein
MKSRYILIALIALKLLFIAGQASAQSGAGAYSPTNAGPILYANPSAIPNNNLPTTSAGMYNLLPQSLTNMFQSYYNSSQPYFGGMTGFNMFQYGGLFGGGNYYIYPPSNSQTNNQSNAQSNTQSNATNMTNPGMLVANNDGSYYIYPVGGGQPETVMPNGDGTYSIYPPGYNPASNSPPNNNNGTVNINIQPEKVVPTNNGGYYIYPPFNGIQPEQIIANGDGTYNLYPFGGGAPERIVPMGANSTLMSGQIPVQTQFQVQPPIQLATPMP